MMQARLRLMGGSAARMPSRSKRLLFRQAGAYGQILHLARQKGYAPLELSGLNRTVLDHREKTARNWLRK
jgi:hypothetical protein